MSSSRTGNVYKIVKVNSDSIRAVLIQGSRLKMILDNDIKYVSLVSKLKSELLK